LNNIINVLPDGVNIHIVIKESLRNAVMPTHSMTNT